jgi:hypothetical protein
MDNQMFNVLNNLIKNPKLCFTTIKDSNFDKYKFWLISLLGISVIFNSAISKSMGDQFGAFGIFLYILIFGPIFGTIFVYLLSGLISITGKWIKGQAKTNEVINIISIAAIPLILNIIVNIVFCILFGKSLFESSFNVNDFGTFSILIYKAGYFIGLILEIYYLILFVIGISVLQEFSILKSILNIFMAVLLLVISITLIFMIFSILNKFHIN